MLGIRNKKQGSKKRFNRADITTRFFLCNTYTLVHVCVAYKRCFVYLYGTAAYITYNKNHRWSSSVGVRKDSFFVPCKNRRN